MGQIHLATGLALNAVLGLCCLQNICCPFFFFFLSKSQTAFLSYQFISVCGKIEISSFFLST